MAVLCRRMCLSPRAQTNANLLLRSHICAHLTLSHPHTHCPGALDFWYSHAMISAEAHNAISENCDFRWGGCGCGGVCESDKCVPSKV